MKFDWHTKEIVVIGGTGVLGAEIARQMRSAGATVSIVARTPQNLPDDLRDLTCVQADIRQRDSLAQALATLGDGFDGLVNAAGVVAFGALGEVPADVVAELFDVNAIGTMNTLALGADVVREGGFVASLSGAAADVAVLNMSAYCASKSAAHAAMAVASRELRRRKIVVLDVRAPHTETGLTTRSRWGTAPKMPAGLAPSFVAARIVVALASEESDLPSDAFTS
jgi:short-subunit dehydrogenase